MIALSLVERLAEARGIGFVFVSLDEDRYRAVSESSRYLNEAHGLTAV